MPRGSGLVVAAPGTPPGHHRFEEKRALGQGGMAVVQLVRDNALGRDVAVKSVRDGGDDANKLNLFLREARITARLEHPNIIPVHDVGVSADGRAEVVMRVVDGRTLADVIRGLRERDAATVAEYTLERRLEVFVAILRALQYAHERGVIHRDIKPDNIMMGRYGEVFIVDWGVAFADGEHDIAPPGAVIGSPLYMSPEQARGEPLDPRSDLYSAAVVLHEMLKLHHYLGEQFQSAMPDLVMNQIATQGWRWPVLDWGRSSGEPMPPMELFHFLYKALSRNRDKRFPTASDMIYEITRMLDGRTRVQCHITFVKALVRRSGRMIDRMPILSFALFAAICLLVVRGAMDVLRSWTG